MDQGKELMMTALEWPVELPAVDRDALCAELDSLIEQVIDEEMHALDTLDDQFARMAAALLALLRAHQPDQHGRCQHCPAGAAPCEVLQTVHQYLKQPLTLLWWHLHQQRRDRPMPIDEVGAWLAASQTPHAWDRSVSSMPVDVTNAATTGPSTDAAASTD